MTKMGASPSVNKNQPFGRYNEWRIVSKNKESEEMDLLGDGSFGLVFKVKNIKTKEYAALKIDQSKDDDNAVKLEVAVLTSLKGKPHVPELYHAAKREDFHYMISLLGKSLRDLKYACRNSRFTSSTWLRIGIQCLYALKVLHDGGFIHRDIKPANFMLGSSIDPNKARIVHIIDFGLSRRYAYLCNGGIWLPRKARLEASFRGTRRYVSPMVHDRKEQCRRDDIWSLMYILIEFDHGLPWSRSVDKDEIEWKKLNYSDKALLKNFPSSMHSIIAHLRQLDTYDRPNYLLIYRCIFENIEKLKINFEDPFDWESTYSVQKNQQTRSRKPYYYKPEKFFKSDPVKIDGNPEKFYEDEAFKRDRRSISKHITA